MTDRRFMVGGAILGSWLILALLAPLLGLRDPAAQPDGLVLSELPPMSRVETIVRADGELQYVDEWREGEDGSIEFRRGPHWSRLERHELAGSSPDDWLRSSRFLLGTDRFGRDLLSRLIFGSRVSLAVGLVAAAIALTLGTLVGSLAALGGRWVDSLLMRLTDLTLSVPRLFLALTLVALYGASLGTTILVLGCTTWMAAARLVRGEILSLREREYVVAATAIGLSTWRLATRHLLPAAFAPLIVEGSLRVGETILLEATLSFLGLGVPSPTPSWGNLIADGRDRVFEAWWLTTIPGLAIVATVISLSVVGDAFRERRQSAQLSG